MFANLTDPNLIACLNAGGVVVAPTDTVYGLLARASNQQAVQRVYDIRGRAPEKPLIALVAGEWQIADTSLWTDVHRSLAARYWPGAVSIVAPTAHTGEYLHRGTRTLAYRVPDHKELCTLLASTGMLVAPSANPQGEPTATTIAEAQAYFGDKVDGYVDGGTLEGGQPSTLVTVVDGKSKILRHGAVAVTG